MTSEDIKKKISDLVSIYQDENRGPASDDAKKLLAELAGENARIVSNVRNSLRGKIAKDKEKIISEIMKAVEKIRNDNTTQAKEQTAAKPITSGNSTKDLSQLKSLLDEANGTENQPKQVNQKPKPIKPKANRRDMQNEILDNNELIAEINDFIHGKIDDYSDALVKFMENKENALKMLNFLHNKYTNYSGPLNPKIIRLAITAYSVNGKDADITDSVKSLLEKLSEHSVKKYLEKNKSMKYVFFKDPFLSDIKTNTMPDYLDLLSGITKKHVQDVLGRLPEEDKIKYLCSLSKKNGLEQYNPREQNKPTRRKKKTGDENMTEENNSKPEVYTPTDAEKADCEKYGITASFKNKEELMAAVEEAKKKINESDPENGNKGEDNIADTPQGAADDKDKGEDKGIKIDGEGGNAPSANEDEKWFIAKRKYYDGRFLGKEGYNYQPDETVTNAFAAHICGGYIRYDSKDNVTVSKESGLKVFEILVTEDDNKGRVVNFGPNLEHKQAVQLLAACLIHDNTVGNNPPKLSANDLAMLKEELKDRKVTIDGQEVPLYDVLASKLEKYKEVIEEKENTNTENNEPKAFDEETKKQIKEAWQHRYELSELEAKGVVEKDAEGKIVMEEGKPKIAKDANEDDCKRYKELSEKTVTVGDKEISEKEFLEEKSKENYQEFRAIVRASINDMVEKKYEEKIAKIRKGLEEKKINFAGKEYDSLKEHDKRVLALSGRLNEGDNAYRFVTKDGQEKVEDVTKLDGEKLRKFERINEEAIKRAAANYKSNTNN